VLGAVERQDRLLGVRIAHFDEAEALGAARLAIRDDRGRLDGAVGFEENPEGGIVHTIGEVADVKFHPRISFQRRVRSMRKV